MILTCNAATYSRSNGKSRYLRGQKWSIRAPFLTPHLVNPKHSATNSEEELSGWYHHAKLYADCWHRRRDICPRRKNSSKVQHIWLPAPVALLVVSHAVRTAWLRWSASLGSRPRLAGSLCQVILAYALRSNSRVGTEGSTVSCLINDPWLMLGLETLSINRCLNHW